MVHLSNPTTIGIMVFYSILNFLPWSFNYKTFYE